MNDGGGYLRDQVKTASQDILAPELHAPRGDIQRLDQKILSRDQKMDGMDARLTVKIDGRRAETVPMKGERLAEIRRLDVRVDRVDRELRTAIDIQERLVALEARRPA